MSGIIRSAQWWWDYFKNLFHIKNYYVSGSIALSAGQHEIDVITDFSNPVAIFISTEEPDDGIPSCVGDLNWVSARLLGNGFHLFANIKSNTCKVKYIVEYDSNSSSPNDLIVVD